MTKTVLAFILLTALPAAAQPAAIPLFFAYDQPGANHWLVDNAMHVVLDRPDFLPAAKRDAKILEITVTGKVVRDAGENSTGFSFTLGFWRGGDRLGEASEYCHSDKLSDCADQLGADITSADAIRH